jgi:pimeloyl-ACP methyl ester carboxylesterase
VSESAPPGDRQNSDDRHPSVPACDDRGTGDAIVFIHGHPFDRSMWRPQLDGLSGEFRTIAMDLPGYGAAPPDADPMTMAAFADSVVGTLDRLAVPNAVVVGLSMGGLVTMELGLRHAERLRGVVLAATTAAPVTADEAQSRRERAAAAEQFGMLPLAADMIGKLFAPAAGRDHELVQGVFAMMLAANPAGSAAALRGRALRPDYARLLSDLPVPALVIAGAHDSFSTDPVIEQLAAALPDPLVHTFQHSGHLPNLEEPDHFNAVVADFARRCFSAPAR